MKENIGLFSLDTATKLANDLAEWTEECAEGQAAKANAGADRSHPRLNDPPGGAKTADLFLEPLFDDVSGRFGAVQVGQSHRGQGFTVVDVVGVLPSTIVPSSVWLDGTGTVDEAQNGHLGAV